MSTLLLDSDVFSYLFRDHPLTPFYRPRVNGHILAITFMTVAELFQGAFRAAWGDRQVRRLEAQIKSCLVVPSSHEVCRKWGGVRPIRRYQPISPQDAWIAATALEYDYALVANNSADYHGIPALRIIAQD